MRTSHRTTPVLAGLALVIALVPALAACGGSGTAPSSTHAADATTGPSTTTAAGDARSATAAGTTGHTVYCGTTAGRAWSTNGKSGTAWDVSTMGVPCATATHWASVLSTKSTEVLTGPTGFNCYAQVTGSSAPPVAGSCQAADGTGNFTWQVAAY